MRSRKCCTLVSLSICYLLIGCSCGWCSCDIEVSGQMCRNSYVMKYDGECRRTSIRNYRFPLTNRHVVREKSRVPSPLFHCMSMTFKSPSLRICRRNRPLLMSLAEGKKLNHTRTYRDLCFCNNVVHCTLGFHVMPDFCHALPGFQCEAAHKVCFLLMRVGYNLSEQRNVE